MSKDPNSTYYDAGGMEVLDIIKAKLTPQQYQGFLLGNVIKYSCRMNHKGTFNRDAEKCAFYAKTLSDLESKINQLNTRLDELINNELLKKNEIERKKLYSPPFPFSPYYDLTTPFIGPVITWRR